MTVGPRVGARFSLDDSSENHVGRGLECQIILTDAQCSRIHAVIAQKDNAWWIRDATSRNGTYVNGRQAIRQTLGNSDVLRLGGLSFLIGINSSDSPGR